MPPHSQAAHPRFMGAAGQAPCAEPARSPSSVSDKEQTHAEAVARSSRWSVGGSLETEDRNPYQQPPSVENEKLPFLGILVSRVPSLNFRLTLSKAAGQGPVTLDSLSLASPHTAGS